MTCRDVAGFLMDYVSGELAADVRAQFDHHLGLCSNCQRYLANYKATIEAGRRAFEDEDADASSSVPDDLIRAILASRPR